MRLKSAKFSPTYASATAIPAALVVDQPAAFGGADDQRFHGVPRLVLRERVPEMGFVEGGEVAYVGHRAHLFRGRAGVPYEAGDGFDMPSLREHVDRPKLAHPPPARF